MRWLWFVAATVCFAIVFRTHSMGLAVVCLLGALGFLLMGVLSLVSSRIESRSRDASALLGPDELKRIREIERRKREGGESSAPVGAGGMGAERARASDQSVDTHVAGD